MVGKQINHMEHSLEELDAMTPIEVLILLRCRLTAFRREQVMQLFNLLSPQIGKETIVPLFQIYNGLKKKEEHSNEFFTRAGTLIEELRLKLP